MFDDILTPDELYALKLRRLYRSHGYVFYRMSRFEDYDYYAQHKDFLPSQAILTFTDTHGRLKALRPDVTLSIIERASAGKYYYDENVYRISENTGTWCEIPQIGIECIGCISHHNIAEVLRLALDSLREICSGNNYVLDVADAGTISLLLHDNKSDAEILKCLQHKNIHGLKALNAPQDIIRLAEYPTLDCFGEICSLAVSSVHDTHIHIDFSAVSNLTYYNGIVLKGYIQGVPNAVLSGGQYNIAGKLGAGFAVYLDRIGGGSRD